MSLRPIVSRMPSSVATVPGSSARSKDENSAKLRAFSRSIRVSLRACASRPASWALAPSFRVQARLHQGQHRGVALGREVEARQRRRHHLRRRGFEIEQQAQGFREVDVGKVLQHRSVDAAVEEARENCLAQKRLPRLRLEVEDGASELAEHDSRDMRIERRKERRDVAELAAERIVVRDLALGDVVLGEPEQHTGEGGGVLREQRKVDERHLIDARGRIDSDPSLVGRIQVIDWATGGKKLVAARALMFDQRRHRRRRRANLEDLWPICGAKGNPADAVLFEEVDQAEVQPVARVALDQVETEPSELTARDAALDRHLRDRCGMEASRQLLFDDGAAADAHFVDDHLAGHHAENELLATVERNERALARVNRGLADLAGWRIGVKLLDRAREQQQELVDRGRVGGPRDRAVLDAGSRGRTTAARSCRWSVRTVIACACVDSHGLSFSLADTPRCSIHGVT